jgi:protein-disulfide isomerase
VTDQPTPRDETPLEDSVPPVSHDDFYLESEPPRRNSKPNEDPAVMLPGSMVNYVLIAITFLVVGVLIGQNLPGKSSDLTADQVEQLVRNVLVDSNLVSDKPSNEELADDDPYMGAADAPVVIVEFSDFRCPYCGRHFRETLEPLLENYGDYVKYVYRDYPALGDESVQAALAGACAAEQGKFWETHNTYFANQDKLSHDFYIQTATDQGLDVAVFTACLNSEKYFDEIKSDFIDGQLNGVEGTPGFFINGNFIKGAQPYELFEKIIDRELKKQGITPPVVAAPATGGLLDEPAASTEASSLSEPSESEAVSQATAVSGTP